MKLTSFSLTQETDCFDGNAVCTGDRIGGDLLRR